MLYESYVIHHDLSGLPIGCARRLLTLWLFRQRLNIYSFVGRSCSSASS